jgi:Kef-type K+ transport system membrane component KefB
MGVVLGPGVMGAVFPEYHRFVFNPDVVKTLNGIAQWGVMLFVMLAGIELDLKKVWKFRRESVTTAGLSLGMPLALGCAAAFLLLNYPGWMGRKPRPGSSCWAPAWPAPSPRCRCWCC